MSQSEIDSPGLAALGDIYLRIGASGIEVSEEPAWALLVEESRRLLRIIRRHAPGSVVDDAALALARVISAGNQLGEAAATRNSAVVQSEKARAGKKRRTDGRWKTIRCAIVWVCRQQKLPLTASDSFAESIRKDAIDAAKRFGLTDLKTGTSTRSIERHIAALLKDHRLLNAILEECELQGWL